MKIACPACTAKYSITDDRVQDRLARIRCRKCGATIVIDGKATPPHVYTAQGEATDMADQGEAEYSVDFGEGDQRSMSAREIAKAYSSGTISGDTYVWTDGFADWKPLSDVPELMEAVSSPAAARAANKPSPWESRAGSAPRAAARSSRSPTADLFGGIDTAGSEDDVATSAPEHHASSAGSGAGSSTGARNESSVLFSLSALTSAANTRPSTRPSSSTSRDDSGLIDLKALTAAAMKSDAGASQPIAPAVPAVAPLAPLGAPPLGLAAPLGGGITATTDIGMGGYPQQKSKAPLYVGGLLGVGMLAIAAALFLRPAPPPPPAPIVVAAPPTATPPAPAPAPSPVQDAKPPATGAGEEAAPPTTQPKATTPAPRVTRRPSTTTPKKTGGDDAAPAAAPKAAPAKKTGGCGCASGDLQCAMRCAAKGG